MSKSEAPRVLRIASALSIAFCTGVSAFLTSGISQPAHAMSFRATAGQGAAVPHGLGFIASPLPRGLSPVGDQYSRSTSYPAAVDLSKWDPPVGDQGQVGSCTAWATAYNMRYWILNHDNNTVVSQSFAPMYQYQQITGGQNVGTSFPDNLNIEVNQGAVPDTQYSRGANAGYYDYTDAPAASDHAAAANYKIKSYSNLFEGQGTTGATEAIKGALASGQPVLVAIPVYDNFMYAGTTHNGTAYPIVVGTPQGQYYGGHALFAPKYDANGLWIQNQWGTGWGASGWAELSWAFVAQNAQEAWTVTGLPPTKTVTDGGGSSDFLLETATTGQTGAPSAWTYSGAWTGYPHPLGGVTQQTPAVVTWNGQFHAVVLGTDGKMYTAWYSPTTSAWTGWQGFPLSTPTGSAPFSSAPAAVVYDGQLEIFVRGNNGNIWQAFYNSGSGWHGWSALAGTSSSSAPAATPYTGNGNVDQLHLFYVSANSGKDLMEMVFNQSGGPSNSWTSPFVAYGTKGPWASAPAVAQYSNTLQIWVVSATDKHLYQYYYSPSVGAWAGPRLVSNDLVGSAPAVTQFGAQFQVFYVMGDTTGTWQTKQVVYDPNNGGWSGPTAWGTMSSAPAIAPYGTTLEVWYRDFQ